MPLGLGFGELLLIFAVLLLLFGAKRLPELASGMGKGIRDFKRGLNGLDEDAVNRSAVEPPQPQQQVSRSQAPPAPTAQAAQPAQPASQAQPESAPIVEEPPKE